MKLEGNIESKQMCFCVMCFRLVKVRAVAQNKSPGCRNAAVVTARIYSELTMPKTPSAGKSEKCAGLQNCWTVDRGV